MLYLCILIKMLENDGKVRKQRFLCCIKSINSGKIKSKKSFLGFFSGF